MRDLFEEPIGEVGSIGRESLYEADVSSKVSQDERHVVRLDGAGDRKRRRRAKRVVDGVQADQRTTTNLMEPETVVL